MGDVIDRLTRQLDRAPLWIQIAAFVACLCIVFFPLFALGDYIQHALFGGPPEGFSAFALGTVSVGFIIAGFKGVLGRRWRTAASRDRLVLALAWASFAAAVVAARAASNPDCYMDWDGRSNPGICE